MCECSGPIPGFDPVGSLLKSSWLEDRRVKQQQARLPEALEAGQGQLGRSGLTAESGRGLAAQQQARQQPVTKVSTCCKFVITFML